MSSPQPATSPFDESSDNAPSRTVAGLGLTCFVTWTTMLLCFDGSLRDDVADGGRIVHDPFFCAVLAPAVLVLLAASWASALGRSGGASRKGAMESLATGPAFGIFVVLAMLGSALPSVLSHALMRNTVAPLPFATAMGVIAGPGLALLTLRWGRVLASLSLHDAVRVLCFALCGQWLALFVISALGFPAEPLAALVLPLVSWQCLARLSKRPAPAFEDVSGGTGPYGKHAVPPLARIAAAMLCFSFAVQLISASSIALNGAQLHSDDPSTLFLGIFLETGAVVAGMLYAMQRLGSYHLELFYRAAFFFAVMACFAFALVPNISAELAYMGIYVSYALLLLTVWILSYNAALLKGKRPDCAFGLVFGAELLGFLAGFTLSSALGVEAFAGEGTAASPKLVLLVACAIVSAYCFILPEKNLLEFSPRVLQLSRAGMDERCAVIAREAGLTEREAEVLLLLARGRDALFVEQELLISRNTVKTHRKNIYRKLGIHTQQELLSLIEEPQ
ncbi:helix-turn-helix domain-containing protein [Adlercreutzia aquisgranensis]|uniref:helix-turn-helix domain-containing protein n=1 Tax=Adlercreutzia aquisgranensis TaxID=2941323 RepID=UPI0020411AC5|nr:helix-turn-helix transcriptional regulator [Adlercreutzia aquisgranensis]